MHSVESLQYVLTQLADLTGDEKSTVLLVKAAQGLVLQIHVLQIHVHEYNYTCTCKLHLANTCTVCSLWSVKQPN